MSSLNLEKNFSYSKKCLEVQESKQKNLKFKTELCLKFMTKGKCRYKNYCEFAHGSQELIPKHVKPTFRTKLCGNYHNMLTCPYGTRCQFKHSTWEEKKNSSSKYLMFQLTSKIKLFEKEILKGFPEPTNKQSRFSKLFTNKNDPVNNYFINEDLILYYSPKHSDSNSHFSEKSTKENSIEDETLSRDSRYIDEEIEGFLDRCLFEEEFPSSTQTKNQRKMRLDAPSFKLFD